MGKFKTQQKYKVSMVGYQNTLPFLYGLEHHPIKEQLAISLEVPSATVTHFLSDDCDIALIPVYFISQNPQGDIFSDFCIGSEYTVQTVAIYSNVPIEDVTEVYLDKDSLTSIHLAKILAKEYWHINPQWKNGLSSDLYQNPSSAMVAIGDKTFSLDNQYKYKYDLVEEWRKHCGLPFAFAVWVAKKYIPMEFLSQFNEALKLGVENLPKIIKRNPQLGDYLTNKISYYYTKDKKEALKKYLSLLRKI